MLYLRCYKENHFFGKALDSAPETGINTQVQSSNMGSGGNSTPAELREPHACPPWGSSP